MIIMLPAVVDQDVSCNTSVKYCIVAAERPLHMGLISCCGYQRGSPCQDPAGNRTTRRPPDHRKETQTKVVWTCLPFIRSGQNHLERHSERGKKTRQTDRGGGKTTLGNGQAWSSSGPRGQWRTEKWRTLVVKSSVVPQRPPRLRDR